MGKMFEWLGQRFFAKIFLGELNDAGSAGRTVRFMAPVLRNGFGLLQLPPFPTSWHFSPMSLSPSRIAASAFEIASFARAPMFPALRFVSQAEFRDYVADNQGLLDARATYEQSLVTSEAAIVRPGTCAPWSMSAWAQSAMARPFAVSSQSRNALAAVTSVPPEATKRAAASIFCVIVAVVFGFMT